MNQNICPVSKRCGGCQYIGISYEEQLKKTGKQGKNPLDVSDLFERYMGVGK